jgi:hypothetical protein
VQNLNVILPYAVNTPRQESSFAARAAFRGISSSKWHPLVTVDSAVTDAAISQFPPTRTSGVLAGSASSCDRPMLADDTNGADEKRTRVNQGDI